MEGSSRAKNQLDPSICFDRTPTCDRQTDTDRHLVIGSTCANIVLRKKHLCSVFTEKHRPICLSKANVTISAISDDLEDNLPVARLFKWNLSNICSTFHDRECFTLFQLT